MFMYVSAVCVDCMCMSVTMSPFMCVYECVCDCTCACVEAGAEQKGKGFLSLLAGLSDDHSG